MLNNVFNKNTEAHLFPKMIHFDVVDYSAYCSKEVMFLLTLSSLSV